MALLHPARAHLRLQSITDNIRELKQTLQLSRHTRLHAHVHTHIH